MLPRRGDVVESGTAARSAGIADLVRFRHDLHSCFSRRADSLFALGDAMLCAAGPVASPVELSLEPEFGRGHGSTYDALGAGVIDTCRLRRLLTSVISPARAGEPLMFGVDVTPLPRPDARFADGLSMVHLRGSGGDRVLPGWPVSVLVGIGWGSSSWVDPIDARRVLPGSSHLDAPIEQVTTLLRDLTQGGVWHTGDPSPLVMFDSGYPGAALAHRLAGQAVQLLVRVRADRVFYGPPPPRRPGARGRAAKHGQRLACKDPETWPSPDQMLSGASERYGTVAITAWHGRHQQVGRDGEFANHPADQELPAISGTLIRVKVQRLPHGGAAKPLWLWHHAPPGTPFDLDLLWKAYLRRFDQEHFHRFAKVYCGLDNAHLQSAEAVDRWCALILACYAQLRLAAPLVADQPRSWQRKTTPGTMPTPCRTRHGFRRLRAELGTPAGPAKKTRPGPGRPPGRRNTPKAPIPVYRKSNKQAKPTPPDDN